jgi:hypothetical protein
MIHTAANVHDSKVLEEAVDAISHRSASLLVADHANAPRSSTPTQGLRLPSMPRGAKEEGHNPTHRSVGRRVQREAGTVSVGGRTLSWVNRFRRLKVHYERPDDIHQAFLDLGCALICWRYVQRLC